VAFEPDFPLDETARKLLLARAERLRQKPEAEDEDFFWVAEFPLGGEAYGLPLDCLVACQPLRLVTPVPLSSTYLAGIVRFQRRILSVLSLSSLLGSQGWRRDPSVLLILKLEAEKFVAVDCEEIPRAVSLPSAWVARARQTEGLQPVVKVERPGQSVLRLIEISNLLSVQTEGVHGA
jgi:chemotaxis signal transduction protein